MQLAQDMKLKTLIFDWKQEFEKSKLQSNYLDSIKTSKKRLREDYKPRDKDEELRVLNKLK